MLKAPVSEFIALDCETTGLDHKTAEIIEIALIKFEKHEPVDRVIHFVNPGQPIPLRNKRLTGIDDSMVQNAPPFEDLADDILAFIGEQPLVGHNIQFDLKFLNFKLRKIGLEQLDCPNYDTLRLSALFFPEEPSLKLSSLAKKFEIDSETSHRAGADAELSGQLFVKLQEYILTVPPEIINLLASMGNPDDGATYTFLDLMKKVAGYSGGPSERCIITELLNITTSPTSFPPGDGEIDNDLTTYVKGLFETKGRMASLIENFAPRKGQPEMAESFAEHIIHGGFNVIEAACGIGKTPAYLVPSVLASARGIKPIIISTYTKNLQDQLSDKDVPALAPLHPDGLKFTTLKGRGNYVCLNRVIEPSGKMFGADRLSPFERSILLSWIHSTKEGDINKLNYFILNNFNNLKSHLNFLRAEGEFCQLNDCRWYDKCFVRASRKRAAGSDIIITNHSLFFAGFEPDGNGPKILPEFKHVIFDEAHHLEDSITQSMRVDFDSYIAVRLLKRFGDLLGRPEFDDTSPDIIKELIGCINRLKRNIENLSKVGERTVRRLKTGSTGSYAPRLILMEEITDTREWMEFCSESASFLLSVEACKRELEKAVSASEKGAGAVRLAGFALLLGSFEEAIRRTVEPDFASDAIWLDSPPSGKMSKLRINVRPLSVGEHFREMASTLDSCQFTSATLSALGNIQFFNERLGIDGLDVDFKSFPAPFDLANQARLLIPTDIEPPAAPDQRIWGGMREGYVGFVANALQKIIIRFGGHTLCLFTSIQDMNDVGETIHPVLEEAGINCLSQFRDGGKNALIEEFKGDPRTALLGTRSFFEGVDIPNSALKCLVIARLPFPYPEEPVHFSRLRNMAEDGIDGFSNLSLPMANLSLRQAVGRLIRTPDDQGVVIFLDNRLISKNYGEMLMNGLESIPYEIGELDEIIEKAATFVGL